MNKKIEYECMFCASNRFEVPSKSYQPVPGETIRCAVCAEWNSFSKLEQNAVERTELENKRFIQEE